MPRPLAGYPMLSGWCGLGLGTRRWRVSRAGLAPTGLVDVWERPLAAKGRGAAVLLSVRHQGLLSTLEFRVSTQGPLRLASSPPGCRVWGAWTPPRGSARHDVASNRPGRNPAVTRGARRAKAPGCLCLWVLSIGQAIESPSGVGSAMRSKPPGATNARNRTTSTTRRPALTPTAKPHGAKGSAPLGLHLRHMNQPKPETCQWI